MSRNAKANMYVDIASVHDEVTGSCHECTVRYPDGTKDKFLVDCGLFQEEGYYKENFTFPFDAKDIGFVLVTHNHIDHIGRIPKLYKEGFSGKTYASPITAELMQYALENTAQILTNSSLRNNQKNRKVIEDSSIPVFSSGEPLFTIDDVTCTMEHVVGVEYSSLVKITPHISAMFVPNGHLLGAASIFVSIKYKGEKPIYLFFSGDYAKKNVFFDVAQIPVNILSLPMNIIVESTYGATSRNDTEYVFDEDIIYALDKKNTIVIPVFALGRSQEVLYRLKKLQKRDMLPTSIPIYFDGKLAHDYTLFYMTHKEYLKDDEDIQMFLPENLIFVEDYFARQEILQDRSTKIIVTTSGMGSYGPAQVYLPNYISSPKATIHFCGYTTPNTFGSMIKELADGELFELNGVMTKKRAKVFSTSEFSGHAKKEDLLDLVSSFKDIKTILINHGEKTTKLNFARYLMENVKAKNTCILSSAMTIRVGAFGLIKTYMS